MKKTERTTQSVKRDFNKVIEWLVYFSGSSYVPESKGDKAKLERSIRDLQSINKQS